MQQLYIPRSLLLSFAAGFLIPLATTYITGKLSARRQRSVKMASTQGISEEHRQALAGVKVGDLVLIESYPKQDESEENEVASEVASEHSQEDGEEPVISGDDGEADVGEDGESSETTDETDSNDEKGDEEDDSEGGEEENATAMLYLVDSLSTNQTGNVMDLALRPLSHCLKIAEATAVSFHIYGTEIVHSAMSPGSSTSCEDQKMINIKDIVNTDGSTEHSIQLNPTGNDIGAIIFNGHCPTQCQDGWIATQENMHPLVSETIRTVSHHAPVCPVCIGKPLMQEHQSLRELLEDSYATDIGMLVEFYGRLNTRRKELGYSFKQFDEREWGMQFDDMLSESEDEDGDAGYWQNPNQEAMDPNADATYYPAPEAAIAALPQKTFGEHEVSKVGEQVTCGICIMKFTDEALIAELPCGHFFDAECAQAWLSKSNSCPNCRQKLPAVESASTESDEEVHEEGAGFSEGGNEVEVIVGIDPEEAQMDGEDVIMSDSETAVAA
jgi:hypothetical protein